jgi:hypothetical protein
MPYEDQGHTRATARRRFQNRIPPNEYGIVRHSTLGLLCRMRHSTHPASSIRWRAGNSDPGLTRNVSCVTYAMRHEMPSPCHGLKGDDFQNQNIKRALQSGAGRWPLLMPQELCCKSSAEMWIAAIGRATLGQAGHALRGKREWRRQPGPPLSAVRRRRRKSPGPSR